jgi:chorismate-pyruvate lyase
VPAKLSRPSTDRDAEGFLESLIGIFYGNPESVGRFELVDALAVPSPYSTLLAHNRHMTVTVEAFHNDAVDVQVLRSVKQGDSYSREIILRTQRLGHVVQYGIVRIHLHRIAEEPKREILEEKKPLGRVLIEHPVLREVELFDLWRIRCGSVLAHSFSVPIDTITFGRTAMIHCDGEPAIELLEIVRPATDQWPAKDQP